MTSEDRSATNRPTEQNAPSTPNTPSSDHPGDYLTALLDRELDPTTADRVTRHVDGCTACLAELTDLERIRRTIRDLPPVPAPEGFMAQLVDKRERATRRGVMLVGVAACLVAAVGLVVAEPPTGRSADRGTTRAGQDDDLVRLEAHRAGNGGDDIDPSVLDRANTAASDLLEFLTG
jgi:anti-sigma factor RsiW